MIANGGAECLRGDQLVRLCCWLAFGFWGAIQLEELAMNSRFTMWPCVERLELFPVFFVLGFLVNSTIFLDAYFLAAPVLLSINTVMHLLVFQLCT